MAVHELLLSEPSQFGTMHRVLRTDPDLQDRGLQSEGKKQFKGDYPPYPERGDCPPHSAESGNKGQSEQKGKGKGKQSVERKKLGMMRTMLKAAEGIAGWEDKVEELKAEIKEQLKLSNQEQQITREAQGTALLQQ
eukprot:15253109-Heterocapsa_arctica.AAC.1